MFYNEKHLSVFVSMFINAAWLVLFDYFLSSILLLLHLLPPSAQGRKKPGKMSATQAMGNLVVFRKVCEMLVVYILLDVT